LLGILFVNFNNKIKAIIAAKAERPSPIKIGSRKGTTIFVIGNVNPKAMTPNKPNSIPFVSVFKNILYVV